jgi:hypothetical protein
MAKEKEKSSMKYGIADFAKLAGVIPSTARLKLRNAKVKPQDGNRYGWNSQGDMQKDLDKANAAAPATKKASGKKDKKATKKAPAKKSAGARKSSKSEPAQASA